MNPARDNQRPIHQYHTGSPPLSTFDELSAEEPLEIRVGGRGISVTMRTPGHDRELTAGFLLTEGVIQSSDDLVGIEPCSRSADRNVINVFLSASAKFDEAKLTRHVFASSSCGLCGKASIASVRGHFPPILSDTRVEATVLLQLPDRLRAAQATFERTGGLHAAGIFNQSGELIVLREDVGRHNAVDKVLGYGLLNSLLFDRHILLVSGRASFEIMQKALAGRLPIVAAVSAPSTLAADFAADSNQTLVGFLRKDRLNVYSGAERVKFEATQLAPLA